MHRASLSKVLRRIAYPVEAFGFEYAQGEPPPPLLEGNRDRMGKQPDLVEKANRRPTNELQYMHLGELYEASQTAPSFLETIASSCCVQQGACRGAMHDSFQHSVTIRAGPSLALGFAFGAKARQECQIDEAAREKQAPDEAPD